MSLARCAAKSVVFGVSWLMIVGFPVEVEAQGVPRSFEQLQVRVNIGDTVYVNEASGQETKGRIVLLSSASLTLTVNGNRREFLERAVTRVERSRRSLRRGLLIGLGAGAVLGWLTGRTADEPHSCCGEGALLGLFGGTFWGGVTGGIAGALIHRREVVYLAPDQP